MSVHITHIWQSCHLKVLADSRFLSDIKKGMAGILRVIPGEAFCWPKVCLYSASWFCNIRDFQGEIVTKSTNLVGQT